MGTINIYLPFSAPIKAISTNHIIVKNLMIPILPARDFMASFGCDAQYTTLHAKRPNTEFFLVHIFPYSD